MNRLLFAFLICFSPNIVWSQEILEDSIQSLVSSKTSDSIKIEALLNLSRKLSGTNIPKALKYTRQAAAMAIELNSTKQIVDTKVNTGLIMKRGGDYDSALNYFNDALKLSRDKGYKKGMSMALQEVGVVHSDKSNYPLAEGYFQEALEIQIALGDQKGLASLLKNFGIIYMDQGYYHTALDYAQRALTIYESLGDKKGISDEYNNIAMIYGHRRDYSKALDYFNKSMVITQEMNDKASEQTGLNNIGYILKQQSKYSLALKKLFKSRSIAKEAGAVCQEYYPLYNIGSIYEITNRLDSAEYYLSNALAKALSCGDQYVTVLSMIGLGNIEMKNERLATAKTLYEDAYNRANKAGLKAQVKDASESLAALYESLKNPDKALEYYKTYHSIKDSIFSQENTTKLVRLEARYEFEQKRKEAELLLQLDKLEQDKKLQEAIWLKNSFVIGFAVMILASFLIYRIYQKERRSHYEMNQLNAEIKKQQEDLLEKASDLKSANSEISRINENLESLVTERAKVITAQNNKILEYVFYNSHQVRGPLSRILGLTALFKDNIVNGEETEGILEDIDNAATELDDMVISMSQTLESQKKQIDGNAG